MQRPLIMMMLVAARPYFVSAAALEPTAHPVAAPVAWGSTDEKPPPRSRLSFYGRGDFDVTHSRDGKGTPDLTYDIWNGSRAGMKGRWETPLSLAFLLHLESGFGTENGRFNLMQDKVFGRQAYAGVESRVGTLTVGRQYPVSDEITSFVDIALPGRLSTYKSQFYWQIDRLERSVIFSSPRIGGFRGRLGYAFGKRGGDVGGSTLTTGLVYTSRQFSAGASLESWETSAFSGASTRYNFWNAGTSFDCGVATVVAGFSSDDLNLDISTDSAVHSRTFAVGGTIPAGKHGKFVLLQQVIHPGKGALMNLSTMRYTHELSPGTNLYVQINTANTAAAAAFGRRGEFMLGLHYQFEVLVPGNER